MVTATRFGANGKTTEGADDNQSGGALYLPRLQQGIIRIPIVGVTPLIPHKWSEKAKNMMREKQTSKGVRTKRDAKDPVQEAFDATYWLDDGRPGMPATAFKGALIGACRQYEGLPMTVAKVALFVSGEGAEQLVPIEGEYAMREDTPRNATGVADLRYRNYFWPWRCTLEVRYLTNRLDAQSVVNLVYAAGIGGVGDWRPSAPKSATGTFGQFEVDESREVEVLR